MLLNRLTTRHQLERFGSSIEGTFKYNQIYLPFSLRIFDKSCHRLVAVFSGVDQQPGRCSMSYYGMRKSLNCNVLHIKDNIGAHGCYFARVAGDPEIQDAVRELVLHVVNVLNIPQQQLFFIGTSKGGTEAILAALNVGYGNVIAGEPQVLLGAYLMANGWEENAVFRSIIYVMLGSLDRSHKETLNRLVLEKAELLGPQFEGSFRFLHGDTGYLEIHITPLAGMLKELGIPTEVVSFNTTSHNAIINVFSDHVHGLLG